MIDDRGQLLLVKGWLGSQKWMLPGGGCKKGETDKAAAARELWEETGVRVRPQDFSLLKEFKDSEFGYDGSLLMATTRHHKLDALGGLAALEIIDRAWWPQKTLPERHSPLIDEALGYLRSGVK